MVNVAAAQCLQSSQNLLCLVTLLLMQTELECDICGGLCGGWTGVQSEGLMRTLHRPFVELRTHRTEDVPTLVGEMGCFSVPSEATPYDHVKNES